MDHGHALTTKASERYLLGEMTEPERFDFEDHYFGCEVCAEDIRTGEILVRGIKTVCAADERFPRPQAVHEPARKPWAGWFAPSSLIPSAAAACFAVIAGYQAFVQIPPLRALAIPLASEPVVLRAAARGDEQIVNVERGAGLKVLSLDVNSGEPGQDLRYELIGSGSGARFSGAAKVPQAGSQLSVTVSNATLLRAETWTLILRTPSGAEVGRYDFKPKLK